MCLCVRYGGASHMKLPFSGVCVDIVPGASETAVFLLNTPPSPSAPSQRYAKLFAFGAAKKACSPSLGNVAGDWHMRVSVSADV